MTKTAKNKLLHHLNFLKSIGYNYHKPLNLISNEINSFNLPNNLSSLKNSVEHCYLCDLSKTRKNVVFGDGNPNADIMFISDFPGSLENESGKIFVGRSGELLTKMIENVLGIKREDVFLANIVKCKPTGTSVGSNEANLCKSYLFKQIELIKPKIIVTLGELSYQYLTDEDISLLKVRGQTLNYKNITLVPTFDPSFLLRNPSSKKDAYVDMLKIKKLMESIS